MKGGHLALPEGAAEALENELPTEIAPDTEDAPADETNV